MTGSIIGNQNPLVGTTYTYEIKPSGLSFGLKSDYEWYLYKKQKNGIWKDITNKPKRGEKVTYRFGEIGLGIEFQMKVYEIKKGILPGMSATKELAGSCILVPTSDKVSKIEKVILFNRGAKDVNKASYRDTLIAQAHCIAMFNKEIEFHLWEDDAPGKGHDANINKNNRHTRSYKARVNEKGIAEVSIPLMSDEKILRQMANQFLMKGDRNEGANHEYYVTATYSGKIQGASQVNVDVANPDDKGQPQNQPQPKSQPGTQTPKFPTKHGGGPKQPDPKGNIIEALFIDDTGNELSKVAVGDKVRVRIHSKNMVGKHIQYVVWEYDSTSNDEVYRSGNIKIPADVCDTSGFIITKAIFEKGVDSPIGDPDSDKQNYFIEIISKDLSAESQKFGVNSEGLMQVEKVKSAAGVQNTQKPDKPGSCICQEQYKDLIWGGKVSCEFRKKVVQICAELWGENRKMEMANGLMAVMNVETSGSFKAQQLEGWNSTKDPKKMTIKDFWKEGNRKSSRAIGLIQFTQDALQNNLKEYKSNPKLSVEERFDELNKLKLEYAQMGEIKQLDKVKKYFEPQKNNIKSPEDIYLSVFAPIGVGKSDDFILYQKNDNPQNNKEKTSNKNYNANKSVDEENNNDKKIQRREILGRYNISFSRGSGNKPKTFNCENAITIPESSPPKSTKWHDPVDNPMLCLYTQNGNYRPRYNVFGTVRKERSNHNHQGIDFLALPGSNAYACVDAYVEFISIQSGYGNVICLKVKDPKEFLKRKRDFSLQYSNMGEIQSGSGFSFNGDFYLFYAHLQEVEKSLKAKQEVSCGTIIGKNGTSGYGQTKDPHLHFEIRSSATGGGLTNRCHPGIFVYYKDENTMSQKEKDYQKEIAQKFWD
ncbi:Peptidase family M23 [Chryseobacterium rhizoplanae]|uniref:Peptidase family M23 n=1 Tax=Chryseobacterium rhizoplanae TaxID=1609531 RepID=A0A521F416_9FLAO|nr:M23 family metallopeptidase [Chryseobacterium rhizoplanae]SMO90879.1 Peptidase family M23 [Chryseobacterium rhizoplanae]